MVGGKGRREAAPTLPFLLSGLDRLQSFRTLREKKQTPFFFSYPEQPPCSFILPKIETAENYCIQEAQLYLSLYTLQASVDVYIHHMCSQTQLQAATETQSSSLSIIYSIFRVTLSFQSHLSQFLSIIFKSFGCWRTFVEKPYKLQVYEYQRIKQYFCGELKIFGHSELSYSSSVISFCLFIFILHSQQ